MLPQALLAARSVRPDVIHIHSYELILIAPFLKLLTNARLIYDVWEANLETMTESRKMPSWIARTLAVVFRALERRLCRVCDLIITADCQIADAYRGIAEVAVVKNYPILSMFSPDGAKRAKLKEKYEGKRIVVYAGGMGEERGLSLMLLTTALVRRSVPNVVLLLVGALEAEQLAQVKAIIQAESLENNVEAVGWVPFEDVANYISVADIGLIFLSGRKWMKNIPQKVFEYMGCGIPVVCGFPLTGPDLPPIARYLEGTGFLVQAPTPEECANRIVFALEHEDERRAMSLRGRTAIATKWNWGQAESVLLAAYDALDAQGRRRPDVPRQHADTRPASH